MEACVIEFERPKEGPIVALGQLKAVCHVCTYERAVQAITVKLKNRASDLYYYAFNKHSSLPQTIASGVDIQTILEKEEKDGEDGLWK